MRKDAIENENEVLLLHKTPIVIAIQPLILFVFYIIFIKNCFFEREFEKAVTKKYSPKYLSTGSRQKNWKSPVKKPICLVKLQVATFLKTSTPTGTLQGLCLVQNFCLHCKIQKQHF